RSPGPPLELTPWLESGWDDPWREPAFIRTATEQTDTGETILVRFEDDPNRISAFNGWGKSRADWAKAEKPARTASRIFENLYEPHGRIEREAERVELVLGDGILSWRREEGGIY